MESLPDYNEFSKDEKIELLENNGWSLMSDEGNWISENGIMIDYYRGCTLEEAFDSCILNLKLEFKMSTPLNVIDWNMLSMDEYANHLENEFMFHSSGTAKAVMELVNFYREHKDCKDESESNS